MRHVKDHPDLVGVVPGRRAGLEPGAKVTPIAFELFQDGFREGRLFRARGIADDFDIGIAVGGRIFKYG